MHRFGEISHSNIFSKTMAADIKSLIDQLTGKLDDHAYKISDSLARIGNEEVVNSMVELLDHENPETRILAARTLGLTKNNASALKPMLEAVSKKENSSIAGDLLMALEGFDVSDVYVELFRLYLFGSFKVSLIAKELLDYSEFNITPRVIRKAEKHWNHYVNNVRHDEVFELQKKEVEAMLRELKDFIN